MQAGPARNSQCGCGSRPSAWEEGWGVFGAQSLGLHVASPMACPPGQFPSPCSGRLGEHGNEPSRSGSPLDVPPWHLLVAGPQPGSLDSPQLSDTAQVKFILLPCLHLPTGLLSIPPSPDLPRHPRLCLPACAQALPPTGTFDLRPPAELLPSLRSCCHVPP